MKGKVLLGQYLIMIWVVLLLGKLHGYKSCVEEERNALLELKKYIVSITDKEQVDYVLPTWTNDTKSGCCLWEEIKCNRTSGRVTQLSIGGLYLKESSLLNLSLLHPFKEVQSLYLSDYEGLGFRGLFDDVEGYKSLKRLRNLEILDLSSNKFNNSIFPFLNAATSLTTLFLRDNNMDGHFPAKEFKDLTNLKLLDLSANKFNGSIPIYLFWKLKALDLRGNEFSASIELQGICELKNLQELDFSKNKLVGQFPLCFTSLAGLRVLDLSSNQLTGNIPSALSNLESLEYLSLFDNNFEGPFSFGLLTNFSKLKVFKLGSISNSLQVESESSWKPKFQLSVIALQSCNLDKIPHFLLYQNDLRHIDLFGNKNFGRFPSWLLANNTKLEILHLHKIFLTSSQLLRSAHNLIFLDVSVNEFSHLLPENIRWILPHLRYMNISNNEFQGNFSSSLGNMKSIELMDMSHNSFQGKLPRSFVKSCYSLTILKISHNKLSGEIFPESTNFTNALVISMDNNQFTGKIGKCLPCLKFLLLLDISNNSLTGVIPSWIGELQILNALLISNNLLEGQIPISLFSISNLLMLDLSANILYGDIPPQVSSNNPVSLFLQDNNFSGAVPDTLLENITILDLRNNRLSGNIPEFINTQNIRILLLRGNNFTGHIPRQLCALRSIHLLDLANNRLNGSIPSCLSMGKEDTSYTSDFDIALTDVFSSYNPEHDSNSA